MFYSAEDLYYVPIEVAVQSRNKAKQISAVLHH